VPEQHSQPVKVTIIEPPKAWWHVDFQELWDGREFLFYLTWRDFLIRYRQTALGVAWAVIVPFVNMVVFGTIFGKLAGVSTDGLNPYLFYLSGLVLWQYFNSALTQAGNSLVNQAALLTKVYVPRLMLPLEACLLPMIDLVVGLAMLFIVMAWMGTMPSGLIVFLPVVVLLCFLSAFGMGLMLSAINVKYRDVKHIIPFLLQTWKYISVILPFSMLPVTFRGAELGWWRYLYGLNPMVGIIEGFRYFLLAQHMSPEVAGEARLTVTLTLLGVGLPVILVFLALGFYVFRSMEKAFSDVV
jgi:lipopolysaccharide transport system permease protein